MKLVLWMFQSLVVPMMEDENGVLYTTSAVLAKVLGVTPHTLAATYHRHKDEFEGLSGTDSAASGQPSKISMFLRIHMSEFEIRRVRSDLHLWSENDMILHAMYCQTIEGRGFRKDFINFIKQNAIRGCVTQEQLNEMQTQVNELRELLAAAGPSLQTTASAIGSALYAQRGTKPLRTVH
jgi:prophage antirepressor-like protein